MHIVPPKEAPKPATQTSIAASTADSPTSKAQKELGVVIDDLIQKLDAFDTVGIFEKYESPDDLAKFTPEQKQRLEDIMRLQLANPDNEGIVQEELHNMVPYMQEILAQSPELNDAGTEATYYFHTHEEFVRTTNGGYTFPNEPLVFVKVKDQWYIKSGPLHTPTPPGSPTM